MLRILIIDSNKHFTQALNYIVKKAYGDVNILTAERSGDLQKISDEIIDINVVFLDLDIPGENGLEIIKQLRSVNKQAVIVALSFFDEPNVKETVLSNGANMYVLKDNVSSPILQEILT